ncbi:MAG: ABC transporter permease [Acidimicrobiales bacterium]
MRVLYIALVVAAVAITRVWAFRRRRRRQGPDTAGAGTARSTRVPRRARPGASDRLGDVGVIAMREIRERLRGRLFRVGTVVILVAVAAAIIIPTIHGSSGPTTQAVGVVGRLSPEAKQLMNAAASQNSDAMSLVTEPSLAVAEADLRSDKVDLAIVDGDEVLLDQPAAAASSPADPSFVQEVAEYLGVLKAYQVAGLTAAQAAQVTNSKSVPVHTLRSGAKSGTSGMSVIGIVLMFLMLTQYCTWILMGVMQEKSSRVVEVLLATVRPIQLLGGKVLGIGLVAMGQAALIVGFALAVSAGVGSDLLRGAAPLALLSELLWLVLGYAFYCWMYAAAGSTAERQDQVQTLALPLSIPILLGYVFSLTVASSGTPDAVFKVLAYLPPTAPFCMSVLVGLSQVTWWEFLASVLISVGATVGMATFAAYIYRRAVLRTGGRVRVRELLVRASR